MIFLEELNIHAQQHGTSTGNNWLQTNTETITSHSPVNNTIIGSVTITNKNAYNKVIQQAQLAFTEWRNWPAPNRGEIVRQIGEAWLDDHLPAA